MQHGREHPWNLRRITHRHLHDQRNLQDLQGLTYAWTLDSSRNPFENEPSLADDTWPEDVLARLHHEIQKLQLHAVSERLNQTAQLAELSFQAGQESAQKRWMMESGEGSVAPADKRALLMALYHSPLGGLLGPDAFLVRRSLITEVSVELRQCPHYQRDGTSEAQDELCRQHFNWLRGYFNFLNPALHPAYSRPQGRCVVSW